MGSYPINGRLWVSLTGALCVTYLALETWRRPRTTTVGVFERLLTGDSSVWFECVVRGLSLVGLVLAAATLAYAVVAPALQLARWMTPLPASEQDTDYDDAHSPTAP